MQRILEWAVRNSPAMNTLMMSILIVGSVSLVLLRREEFPEFELEVVLVTVPYPGASPEEVEEGICLKLEEAVRSIDQIKKQTAIAKEGSGFLVLELDKSAEDVEKIVNEIRSQIDRIPSFPEFAEEPDVKQISVRQSAIRVAVVGPDVEGSEARWDLRQIGERVRDDLLQLPSISQAYLVGVTDYQIDIEIDEQTLRAYGLSLQQVAELVRRQNIEIPGGLIQTESQELLLRGKNKEILGDNIAKIPLVTQPNGVVLTIGDLGNVRDGFTDDTFISRIDGQPGLMIAIDRTADEDLIAIVDEVFEYIADAPLPEGYSLQIWDDRSVQMRSRLEMLGRNALAGLLLVFLMLAIFLELRLAFWVALGIPVSVLGACAFFLYYDHSLNLLSTFSFLMALGIVVDDAIVIGENIYEHRQRGKKFTRAAVDGAVEVLPSVMASVTTTIIAFMPLMFVAGDLGKFIAIIPVAVVVMLVISLVESMIILPCHLAHSRDPSREDSRTALVRLQGAVGEFPVWLRWTLGLGLLGVARLCAFLMYPILRLGSVFRWLNVKMDRLMDRFIHRVYVPTLSWTLKNPAIVVSLAAALLLVSFGFIQSGITPFVLVQKIDTNLIEAKLSLPDGTPERITNQATIELENAIQAIDQKYRDQGIPIIKHAQRTVGFVFGEGGPGDPRGSGSFTGSHVGSVRIELADTDLRTISSHRIVAEWRDATGPIPGAESLQFVAPDVGPAGNPIEFKLVSNSNNFEQLEQAAEKCKAQLSTYPGVFDVADDSTLGKWEYQFRVRSSGKTLGVSVADLAETVRASFYGEEAMRLQRGRHEVKLMVRYPLEDRQSFSNIAEVLVPTAEGKKPLASVVDVDVERGTSEINRIDQARSITVTADVDETIGNAYDTISDLRDNFMPQIFEDHPAVAVRWEGQQEQTTESIQSLFLGFQVAIFGMFVLLTIAFRSYLQPLLILAIVPFGAIGAVAGHAVLQYPITIFSVFGMVALTGVVVNDSIVLVDFINKRVAAGLSLSHSLLDAGRRRFRPVVLTSITTIAGLLPLLTETSAQAQLILPMAISLCFGLMSATVLVLFLVPVFYLVYGKWTQQFEEQPADETDPGITAALPTSVQAG